VCNTPPPLFNNNVSVSVSMLNHIKEASKLMTLKQRHWSNTMRRKWAKGGQKGNGRRGERVGEGREKREKAVQDNSPKMHKYLVLLGRSCLVPHSTPTVRKFSSRATFAMADSMVNKIVHKTHILLILSHFRFLRLYRNICKCKPALH